MSNKIPLQPSLTFSGIERRMNYAIATIFYYRLAIVAICLIALLIFAGFTWSSSMQPDRLKNFATVVTCGSVIIAIFYSILNYEYTQIRFKHDKKNSVDTLTFTVASKCHDTEMIGHFKAMKKFYFTHKDVIQKRDLKNFHDSLEQDDATKTSVVAVLNYFECISLGIQQELMDETFMKDFFASLFRVHYNYYLPYIEFIRTENSAPKLFVNFTNLAKRWET